MMRLLMIKSDIESIPKIFDGKYFSIVSKNKKNIIAKCVHCEKTLSGTLPSTGNFYRHMKTKHIGQFEKLKIIRKKSLQLHLKLE